MPLSDFEVPDPWLVQVQEWFVRKYCRLFGHKPRQKWGGIVCRRCHVMLGEPGMYTCPACGKTVQRVGLEEYMSWCDQEQKYTAMKRVE